MADKRIIELTNEKLTLGDGDYTIVDSNEGTYKYKLKRIVDSIPAPDTTLSIAGRAADAKAVGDEIADVKRDLSDIETSSTNLFNPAYFLEADGFSKTSEGISAQATKFAAAFWSDYYPFDNGITFEANTQYTFSFKAKTDGSETTSNNGIIVYIYHTDGTEIHEGVSNASSSFVTKTKTSTAGKTVRGIKFTYGSGATNTWTIKDVQFEKGATATDYEPHFTAYDKKARAEVADVRSDFDSVVTENLLDYVSTHSGYMDTSGNTYSASSYEYTDKIPVSVGDTIYTARARFVTFFNGLSAVSAKGYNFGDGTITEHEFAVPDSIDGMVVTLYESDTDKYIRVNNRNYFTNEASQAIKDIVSGFKGKRILNIGDSIAENRVESKSYAYQFAEATGASVATDYALGGSTLSYADNQGTRGSVYSQAVSAVTNHPNDDYDIIFIDGGANDFGMNRALGSIVGTVGQYEIADYTADYNYATILGALEAIFKLLRNQFLNSIIVFVIPHKHDRTGAYWESILDGIREVCDKWSIPILDMDKYGELNTRIVGMRTDYTDEGGTHPNTLGIHKYYLPQLIGLLGKYFN